MVITANLNIRPWYSINHWPQRLLHRINRGSRQLVQCPDSIYTHQISIRPA